MPLEAPLAPVAARVADLNQRYRHHAAADVLRHALEDAQVGRIALVSSFGAESVVLLHMVAVVDRSVPVLFLDTQMLFPETLAYQRELGDHLGLTDVRLIRPDRTERSPRSATRTATASPTRTRSTRGSVCRAPTTSAPSRSSACRPTARRVRRGADCRTR